jgi:glycosyltransferase involved in cell wall biosynthesis
MLANSLISKPVVILLATYNGACYLEEQIESLFLQTYNDFVIVAHDDGSTDGTVPILRKYVERFPDKFYFIDDGIATGSAQNNFYHLMSLCDFDFAFFCDQDDYWHKDKLSTFLGVFPADHQEPTVVYGDLEVVDEGLNLISHSMWEFQRTGPTLARDLKTLACRNPVTGCCMAINRGVKKILYTTPDSIMHDWWIALLVKKHNGNLIALSIPLVKYRQHDSNQVGAQPNGFRMYLVKILNIREALSAQLEVYKMSKSLSVYPNFFVFLYYKVKALLC